MCSGGGGSGGAFGVEGVGAAQHRRRCRGVRAGWVVAVFGAGDQDALDGAVVRIPDSQGAGARGIEAGIAVGAPADG